MCTSANFQVWSEVRLLISRAVVTLMLLISCLRGLDCNSVVYRWFLTQSVCLVWRNVLFIDFSTPCHANITSQHNTVSLRITEVLTRLWWEMMSMHLSFIKYVIVDRLLTWTLFMISFNMMKTNQLVNYYSLMQLVRMYVHVSLFCGGCTWKVGHLKSLNFSSYIPRTSKMHNKLHVTQLFHTPLVLLRRELDLYSLVFIHQFYGIQAVKVIRYLWHGHYIASSVWNSMLNAEVKLQSFI